jgi:hypothetical protein
MNNSRSKTRKVSKSVKFTKDTKKNVSRRGKFIGQKTKSHGLLHNKLDNTFFIKVGKKIPTFEDRTYDNPYLEEEPETPIIVRKGFKRGIINSPENFGVIENNSQNYWDKHLDISPNYWPWEETQPSDKLPPSDMSHPSDMLPPSNNSSSLEKKHILSNFDKFQASNYVKPVILSSSLIRKKNTVKPTLLGGKRRKTNKRK